MDISIIIATHKKYKMPTDDIYLPVHVGAEGKKPIGYTPDNTGDNISIKNPGFCELTGLYWAWKNLDHDYKGLAHYRRHFRGKKKTKNPFDCVLGRKELERYLRKDDVIVTKKRKYYIETIYAHYAHTMHVEPLDATREIIAKMHPDYLEYFDARMKARSQHAFNMFIMSKEKFDAYCEWLFSILFELEDQFKEVEYDTFHSRFYGRISERLLDVWLEKNGYRYKEVPFIYMEKIDMKKKVLGFIKAKVFHKKYDGSF